MKTPNRFFVFACFLTGGIPKKHISQDDPGSGSVPQDDFLNPKDPKLYKR